MKQAFDNGGHLPLTLTTLVLSSDECVVMAVGERGLGEPRALNHDATYHCVRSDHAGRPCVDGIALTCSSSTTSHRRPSTA